MTEEKKKVVVIGTIYDPILDCGHAAMKIEDKPYGESIQQTLLEFEEKRVRITIEEL